jgi:hypothetical protein
VEDLFIISERFSQKHGRLTGLTTNLVVYPFPMVNGCKYTAIEQEFQHNLISIASQ